MTDIVGGASDALGKDIPMGEENMGAAPSLQEWVGDEADGGDGGADLGADGGAGKNDVPGDGGADLGADSSADGGAGADGGSDSGA